MLYMTRSNYQTQPCVPDTSPDTSRAEAEVTLREDRTSHTDTRRRPHPHIHPGPPRVLQHSPHTLPLRYGLCKAPRIGTFALPVISCLQAVSLQQPVTKLAALDFTAETTTTRSLPLTILCAFAVSSSQES